MPFTPSSTEDLLKKLAAKVIQRSDLNDLTEGSVLLHILAAVADEISSTQSMMEAIRDSFHFENTTGRLLDERVGELPPDGIKRLGAANASGSVLSVTRVDIDGSGAYTATLLLPAGSTFSRSDDSTQLYRTTTDHTFGSGIASLSGVYVIAVTAGVDGNCDVGQLNTVVSAGDQIIACNNTNALTNGLDSETDTALLIRARAYISSLARCQPAALEYAALSFVDTDGGRARFASLYEDPTRPGYSALVIDDGSGLAGVDRDGVTVTGTVPTGGQFLLWHEFPAAAPIDTVWVSTDSGVTWVDYLASDGDFTSIPERGQIFMKDGILATGNMWKISTQQSGAQYRVYTGLIASLQTVVEGSTSDPTNYPGLRAAGTRVRVEPPTVQAVAMDAHITPVSGVELGTLTTSVQTNIVAFTQSIAPGEPMYVAQLIDYLMNDSRLLNVRLYISGTTTALEDVSALSYYYAIRAASSDITIIPAVED